MTAAKTIVITGSTRGIGYGLAQEFARRGHNVVVSGRAQDDCDQAVQSIGTGNPSATLLGVACDVRSAGQIQNLWTASAAALGSIDIWINNAGLAHETHRLWEQPAERVEAVIMTNLTGLMLACQVAIKGMIAQGGGQIYNLTGFGRTGMKRAGMTLYGTSKRGVDYATKSLALELKGTPVQISQINPGMVITDMTREGYTSTTENQAQIARIYNILGETPEATARVVVDKVLANTKNGALILRDSRLKKLSRWLMAPLRKRDVFQVPPE